MGIRRWIKWAAGIETGPGVSTIGTKVPNLRHRVGRQLDPRECFGLKFANAIGEILTAGPIKDVPPLPFGL